MQLGVDARLVRIVFTTWLPCAVIAVTVVFTVVAPQEVGRKLGNAASAGVACVDWSSKSSRHRMLL